ncbi:MAG: anion transporter [Opitutales bacterium]|nr:anion transporter [Opitutales bacterium]
MDYLVGAVILITLIGVAVGRFPALHMNRATIAWVGAVALILLGVLDLEAAFHVIDWHTIALLLSMMILNANLRLAGFFSIVVVWVQRRARTPRRLLAFILLVSGSLSAIFLNDTIAVVMTPLVIELARSWQRNPIPYLLGLAMAANIGSVAAITGNPQNMLIGLSSGIPFIEFSAYQIPVAAGGLIIAWVCLVLMFRSELSGTFNAAPEQTVAVEVKRPLLRKSLIAVAVLLAGLLGGLPIALAAMLSASIVLITRRIQPERVFGEVDWGLLVFFCGLFVVTGTIEASRSGEILANRVPALLDAGIPLFTFTAVVLSNLVSNVPAVMLFRPYIPDLADPHSAWLMLAMATTFAGNLTLLGSVANLIVAESAARLNVRLTFLVYLKAGIPVTVLSLLWGCLWLAWVTG